MLIQARESLSHPEVRHIFESATEASKAAFRSLIMAAFDDESLDTKATLKQIRDIMKAQEQLMGRTETPGPATPAAEEPTEVPESLDFARRLRIDSPHTAGRLSVQQTESVVSARSDARSFASRILL